MFFRQKRSGKRTYLQLVENRWEEGRSKQRVVASLGRLDELQEDGGLDSMLRSGARFSKTMALVTAHERGETTKIGGRRIGPPMVFERLWRESGCQQVVRSLLRGRQFGFDVERMVFVEVLHRLVDAGSDRDGAKWRRDYRIEGVEGLQLHHCYRAMAWLGEELPEAEQDGRTPFAPRCTKDLVEERVFQRRRDLFTSLDLVFLDTTSIYFEGKGGETLGRNGHSKDHRPDLRQMVVAAVIDSEGRPVCCEMWPGNTTDVRSLVPVVDRLRARFHVSDVCIVADRGMISKKTLEELEERGWKYILGAKMRAVKEVREQVLSRAGRYRVVRRPGSDSKALAPLKVKEVKVDDHRYVVCLNETEQKKDALVRQAIVESLEAKLKQGAKSLVGNKGYRKYIKAEGARFVVDKDKLKSEARFDGKWVLRTNTTLDAAQVALTYKELLTVERLFRTVKSLLETRPIHHQRDDTIRGHVFCSFLALILLKELELRLAAKNYGDLEWADIIRDLDALEEIELEQDGKRFLLRSTTKGTCGKVFRAAGVALPPTIRQLTTEDTPT